MKSSSTRKHAKLRNRDVKMQYQSTLTASSPKEDPTKHVDFVEERTKLFETSSEPLNNDAASVNSTRSLERPRRSSFKTERVLRTQKSWRSTYNPKIARKTVANERGLTTISDMTTRSLDCSNHLLGLDDSNHLFGSDKDTVETELKKDENENTETPGTKKKKETAVQENTEANSLDNLVAMKESPSITNAKQNESLSSARLAPESLSVTSITSETHSQPTAEIHDRPSSPSDMSDPSDEDEISAIISSLKISHPSDMNTFMQGSFSGRQRSSITTGNISLGDGISGKDGDKIHADNAEKKKFELKRNYWVKRHSEFDC